MLMEVRNTVAAWMLVVFFQKHHFHDETQLQVLHWSIYTTEQTLLVYQKKQFY